MRQWESDHSVRLAPAGVLQRVQRVERVLRQQRYSVTDARMLGAEIIQQAREHSAHSKLDVAGMLGAAPMNEALPLELDEDFRTKWANATREDQLQVCAWLSLYTCRGRVWRAAELAQN